jgi:hypothetical protein
MTNTFNFEEELRKLNEAHKEFEKSKNRMLIQEGFCFDAFLREQKITLDEFYNYPEEKQQLYYAEYEQRKWK